MQTVEFQHHGFHALVFCRLSLHVLILGLLLFAFQTVHAQEISEDIPQAAIEVPVIPPSDSAASTTEPVVEQDGSSSATPAQTSSTPADTASEQLFDRQVADLSRKTELLELYQEQTEAYSEKARLFVIAKGQWESLQTLAALEEAILRTREVLDARDSVSITYTELLLDGLDRSVGIEISQKQLSHEELVAHVEWLRNHQRATQQSTTRDEVNARADEFTAYVEGFQNDTQRAASLLSIGKLQAVLDKTDVLFLKIQQSFTDNPGPVSDQIARSRKYEQVKQLRDEITVLMQEAREPLEDRKLVAKTSGLIQQTIVALDKPYALTSQYIAFMYELTSSEK